MKYFVFLLAFSINLMAYEESFAMKGGVNAAYQHQKTFNLTQDDLGGVGFNTHFGYRWKKWEFNLSSIVTMGYFEKLNLQAKDNVSEVDGLIRNVSFGPNIKYFTEWNPFKYYRFYIGAGPQVALQSFTIDDAKFISIPSENIFSENRKITHRSIGGIISIGFEEILDSKKDYPVYFELAYQYLESRKVYLVDISNTKKVDTIVNEKPSNHNDTHIYMFNIGMTIF